MIEPLHTTASTTLATRSMLPDSLGGLYAGDPFAHTGGYRTVPIEEIFGSMTEQALLPQGLPQPFEAALTGGFSLLVLLLAALYALLLYRHAGDMQQLLGRVLQDRTSEDRLYEDSAGSFSRFLHLANLLGVMALAAAIVRLKGSLIPVHHIEELPFMAAAWWALLLMAALGVAALYRIGVTAAIGKITFTQPLFERLDVARRTCFALLTLVSVPLMAVWLLSPAEQGGWWFYMILIELIISLILYLHETYTLFISKKISILHWILYLCAVEIFPLSLLVVLAGRYL